MPGRAVRIGVVAAVGSAGYLTRRAGPVMLPGLRSRARWLVNHAPARMAFKAAARRGEPMARLLSDPAVLADPHPYYDELRAAGPVVGGRLAAVTARHDVTIEVLRDPRSMSGLPYEVAPAPMRMLLRFGEDPGLLNPLDRPSMVLSNGPEHLVYRRLAMKAFTARAIDALHLHVEQIADDLLDAMEEKARRGQLCDVVDDLADVLPVLVIAEILGVPISMRPQFRSWATAMVAAADMGVSYGTARTAERAIRELGDWMLEHLRALRAEPGDNLLSRMVAAAEVERRDGTQVDERGLAVNAALLLFAGFETTVNLIGNGVDLMLRHPDQLARLQHDPALWPNAVEEILRYASPVQNVFRYWTSDTELHGTALRRGTYLVMALGAANRDPAVFSHPHSFDVARPNAKEHLAFAIGPHFCVGAALARMEGEIALRRLFERFGDLSAAGQARRRPTRLLSGFAQLPVQWTSPATSPATQPRAATGNEVRRQG